MATTIRAEISKGNKYWIDKHRHYELKHFCLQYPIWKREYNNSSLTMSSFEQLRKSNVPSDPTARRIMLNDYYLERITLIEETAKRVDRYLYDYILKAVTEGLSYTYLKSKLDIPCGRDMYYEMYRQFFWLLDKSRK